MEASEASYHQKQIEPIHVYPVFQKERLSNTKQSKKHQRKKNNMEISKTEGWEVWSSFFSNWISIACLEDHPI